MALQRVGVSSKLKGLAVGCWPLAPWLSPKPLLQTDRWGVQKSPAISLSLSSVPLHPLLLLFLTLSRPPSGAEVQIVLGVPLCHFKIPVPALWGKDFRNSTCMVKWVGDVQNPNPNKLLNSEAFQDCSLTQLIPCLGLDNVPALTVIIASSGLNLRTRESHLYKREGAYSSFGGKENAFWKMLGCVYKIFWVPGKVVWGGRSCPLA